MARSEKYVVTRVEQLFYYRNRRWICLAVLATVLIIVVAVVISLTLNRRGCDSAPLKGFCTGKPNGIYADPATCTGFISCNRGKESKQHCLPDMEFDNKIKACNWTNKVDCQNVTTNLSSTPTTATAIPTAPPEQQPSVADIIGIVSSIIPRENFTINNKMMQSVVQILEGYYDVGCLTRLPCTEDEIIARIKAAASSRRGLGYARRLSGLLLGFANEKRRRKKRATGDETMRKIKKSLGPALFKKFLAVDGRVSLVFAIDTTGSMGQEIEAAKNITIAIASYPRINKVDFILSPFNDPGSGPVSWYNSASLRAFKDAVAALPATGGGDCRELTFHGIIDAIEQVTPLIGSPMFVFTDAPPKDYSGAYYNVAHASFLARRYKLPVNFFFSTSSCGDPHKDLSFKKIMADTGGIGLLFGTDGSIAKFISVITAGLDGLEPIAIIDGGPSRGRRATLERVRRSSSEFPFPVDSTLSKIIVYVSANTNGRLVTLHNPSGAQVPHTIVMASGLLWAIEKPTTGTWTFRVPSNVTGFSYQVKGSSVANIAFEYVFLTTIKSCNAQVRISHPLKGEEATMKILISQASLLKVSTLRLYLINRESSVIFEIPLNKSMAKFNPPSDKFKLRLTGITNDGTAFQRISRQAFQAKTVAIGTKITSHMMSVTLGNATPFFFLLHNSGDRAMFTVSANASIPEVSVNVVTTTIEVAKGSTSEGQVSLTTGRSVTNITVFDISITVRDGNTGVEATMLAELMVNNGTFCK